MAIPRGEALIASAEKELKRWFTTASQKNENAAEFYKKAANSFKSGKDLVRAASCFDLSAQCYIKADSQHDAAGMYQEAAKALKASGDADQSQMFFVKCIGIYEAQGKFSRAAKLYEDQAKNDSTAGDLDTAIENFRRAAEMYETEDRPSAATKNFEQVAILLSTAPREDYGEASALFLKVGNTYLEKRLTASSAKKHFMKAGLCMLADKDAVGARARLDKFKDADYTFERSREGQFLEKVIECVETFDAAALVGEITNYDAITTLDRWMTGILLRLKNSLEGSAVEGGADGAEGGGKESDEIC